MKPSLKDQIAAIRAAYREEKTDSFVEWLKNELGRLPEEGDIIVPRLNESRYVSVDVSPFRVKGVVWDWSNPALSVEKTLDKDKIEFTSDWSTLARNRLKGARFARPDEIDGSAYEWEVSVDLRGPWNNKKECYEHTYTEQARFPTKRKAMAFIRKLIKSSPEPFKLNAVDATSSFIMTWDEDDNYCGTIKRERVRKPDHPFK